MAVAIIAFIILLVCLVVIHELGHFLAARKSGVSVLEFSVGMGPKIISFGKDKKGTEFTFRLLPLGGFVRIKGENPHEPETFTAADSFLKTKFRNKVVILLAGIAMNIAAARLIFTVGFWHGVRPIQIIPDNFIKGESTSLLMPTHSFLVQEGILTGATTGGEDVVVDMVVPNTIAAQIGLLSGDIIIAINNTPVTPDTIGKALKDRIGQELIVSYTRGEEEKTASAQCPEDMCELGIVYFSTAQHDPILKYSLPAAMGKAAQEIWAQAKLTFPALGGVIKKAVSSDKQQRVKATQQLSGPVGAARVGQYIIHNGGRLQFLMFGGVISLALAFFNLLPIPALDGGRLLGVIIQKVFRLRPEKYFVIEGVINLVFFVLLLTLGVYIIGQDLVRARGVKIPWLS